MGEKNGIKGRWAHRLTVGAIALGGLLEPLVEAPGMEALVARLALQPGQRSVVRDDLPIAIEQIQEAFSGRLKAELTE